MLAKSRLSLLILLPFLFAVRLTVGAPQPPLDRDQLLQETVPDDLDRIVETVFKNGEIERISSSPLTAHMVLPPVSSVASSKDQVLRPPPKLHPLLQHELQAAEAGTVQVLVNFVDTIQTPQFPQLRMDEPENSEANLLIKGRAAELIRDVKRRRAATYNMRAEALAGAFGARTLENFWLIDAMLIELPARDLEALANFPGVTYVQPRIGGEPPPQDFAANVRGGRIRIASDAYIHLTSGLIGVLDTGMRFTHVQFNNPSHIRYRRDCVNGTQASNCASGNASYNPTDDCWNHGTSTGAILTANLNQGSDYSGVTAVTVDSFKVYTCAGLDSSATVRGFQAAVASLDKVIVAEIQAVESENGSVATAAENAFNAGAAVIAANGNFGPGSGSVRSPALAHKVIGVGAYDVLSGQLNSSSGRGPAPDGRIKPDITAPTNTQTASSASDTALQYFGGTSGATPYAAGAAALLRNWLLSQGATGHPGQVYVQTILAGWQGAPIDNSIGAGPIKMLSLSSAITWRGSTSIGNGQVIDISLSVPGPLGATTDLKAALWWPESTGQNHNNLDLRLVDPSGVIRASSTLVPSIFERALVAGTLTPGNWKIRITGASVPAPPQTVYWAAHATVHIGG